MELREFQNVLDNREIFFSFFSLLNHTLLQLKPNCIISEPVNFATAGKMDFILLKGDDYPGIFISLNNKQKQENIK
jgi:hypothetical protein